MFLVFTGADKTKAARRCKSSGIELIGTEDQWDVEPSGIEAIQYTADGNVLSTSLQVAVYKNCVAVSLNPDVAAALGYQPACPQYLYPGFLGEVDVVFRAEDAGKFKDVDGKPQFPWLVRLHVVPVTTLL